MTIFSAKLKQLSVLVGLLAWASLPVYATTNTDTTLEQVTITPNPDTTTQIESNSIISWHQGEQTDYEAQQAGMGYGLKFHSDLGVADRYVYDLGKPKWADGIDDTDLPAVMDMAITEIEEMGKRGYYQDVTLMPVMMVEIADTPFLVTYGGFDVRGETRLTGIFMTGFGGDVLKYRISLNAKAFDANPDLDVIEVMTEFVTQDVARLRVQ